MARSKKKYYLIDTENVGDRWYDLPGKLGKHDRIITFYSLNHSKKMEKFLAKQLHNPKILWLECATGANALDYQMIGVLSYLIARHPKASFCIFSNDMDYHDSIEFWKQRGIDVSQMGYEVETGKKKKKKKGKKEKALPAADRETESPKDAVKGIPPAPAEIKKLSPGELTEEQYVIEIAKSIPVTNLNGWYNALTALLGQEAGRDWYLAVRQEEELRNVLSGYCTKDTVFKGVNLVAAVLNRHNLDVARAEEAYKIIQAHNRKNLTAMREDFDVHFGKKPPQGYFKALRPLIRILK